MGICFISLVVNTITPLNLNQLGIMPRSIEHLFGILLSPFLHNNFYHLLSNFLPFIVFSILIAQKSMRRFWVLFILQIVATGALVWLFGRGNTVHIGMSGVIYAFWGYLIVYGLVRREFYHLIISVITVVIYGGLAFGVLPSLVGNISFESHLFGALSGGVSGFYFAKFKR